MHPALARAWLETNDPADQLWFGKWPFTERICLSNAEWRHQELQCKVSA
jgi:hypothetical protein